MLNYSEYAGKCFMFCGQSLKFPFLFTVHIRLLFEVPIIIILCHFKQNETFLPRIYMLIFIYLEAETFSHIIPQHIDKRCFFVELEKYLFFMIIAGKISSKILQQTSALCTIYVPYLLYYVFHTRQIILSLLGSFCLHGIRIA